MNERTIHYLSAIRQACRTAMQAVDAAAERRRLEQVYQILSRLIVEARTLPELQTRALSEYRRLLPLRPDAAPAVDGEPAGSEFDTARAVAQELLRTAAGSADGSNVQLTTRIVAIEREYFQRYDQAFQQEVSAGTEAARTEQGERSAPDAGALGKYLSGVFGTDVEVSKLDTVALGYSKATLLVSVRTTGKVPGTLVIRMDRPFNFLGTTVVDEYPILQTVHRNGVRVPRPYALESTGGVLGQPFMVMERVYGRNIGSHFVFPDPNPALCAAMAAKLAEIHCVPVREFAGTLKGTQHSAEQQLCAEIEKYYADWSALKTVSPIIEAAFQWLKRHVSEAIAARTLVHGDFSLSNVLVDDTGEVSAILDWEFARLGTPASDLGWFYFGASRLAGWEYFLKAYQKAGAPLPDKIQLDFYILWGALRLAVMNYQVECGFDTGRSSDIKHAYVATSYLRETVLRVSARLSELLARQ